MKEDVVSNGVVAIQAAEVEALKLQLGLAYDAGFADAGSSGSGGSFSQADIDAAVKSAKDADAADLQAVKDADALALQAAKDQASSDLASLQSALDAMAQKEQIEEAAVADVNAKIEAVQASFDAIKALFLGH